MNEFLPIKNKKIGILGAGQSGIAAAKLAYKLGANVFVSDINKKKQFSLMMAGESISFDLDKKMILE